MYAIKTCCADVVTGATEDAITAAREAFRMHLAKIQKAQQQQHTQDTSEEDLSQMDERELEAEFAGHFFSASCDISSVLACGFILSFNNAGTARIIINLAAPEAVYLLNNTYCRASIAS